MSPEEMFGRRIDVLIDTRYSTHGNFRYQGATAQRLKEELRRGANWPRMHLGMREGLDMIQHKIARILEGDPNFEDHWEDIAGYAKAVIERILRDRVPQQKYDPAIHAELNRALGEGGSYMAPAGASPLK